MRECKFCGIRFDNERLVCPNCGSRNIQNAKPEYNGWLKESVMGNGPKRKKKKLNNNLRKVAIFAGGILVILFIASQVMQYLKINEEAERRFEEKEGSVIGHETDRLSDGWTEDTETVRESEPIEKSETAEESENEKLLSEEQINKILQSSQNKQGTEWQKVMFPLLNRLYEQNQCKELFDIYVNTKKQQKDQQKNKPISKWEHYLFIRTLYDLYDIESVLAAEEVGEQVKEWQYINLLMDYFAFEDFENKSNISDEEKEKLMPYVIKLREDAEKRWNLSEKEWEELRQRVISEYDSLIYEEAELFVEAWMETKGYPNDGETIEEEIINAIDLEEETWKKRFYPKLDKLYEQGADEELYNACEFIYASDRSFAGWTHKNYVEMLEYYYRIESVWDREEKGREPDVSDNVNLLYTYLIYENWETRKQLSAQERERLVPYREKIIEDGRKRWNFTKEQWEEIFTITTAHKGEIYYYEVRDFIERWMENES